MRVGEGHGYVDQFLKLPSKWCILKDVLTYSLGNREETNAQLQV
jgi:5-formyltetrahydrofolate cyclo-ligase